MEIHVAIPGETYQWFCCFIYVCIIHMYSNILVVENGMSTKTYEGFIKGYNSLFAVIVMKHGVRSHEN